jgi:U3 small nucleolar RNA-associated protein 22
MASRKAYEENTQNISAAMYLATSYDKASEAWTRFSPNSSELKRVAAYAQSSANLLTKLIQEDQNDSHGWECLLRTPLQNYDAVILLHRDKLPYPQRLLFPSELNQGRHVAHGDASKVFHPFLMRKELKGSSLGELQNKLLVNFNPLRCFVDDLEEEMSSSLKLWYDSLGGDAVGITWNNSKKRGRQEDNEDKKDSADVLRAVGELGKGLVRDIYLLKSPKLGN